MTKYMLCVKDVQEILGVKSSMAYKIIRQMNEELSKAGYIVVAGKVPRTYWDKKFYGSSTMNVE